jgi:capsular exopolysaccharide synthesis family protein
VSKIFDALRKAQGEVASLALPLIDGAGTPGAGTDQRRNTGAPQGLYHPSVLKAEPKQLHVEETHVEHLARVIFHTDPTSTAADRFRLLRMRLDECWKAGRLKSILVSSPLPGDGKSTTALNLATALAEKRTRSVLLVDADLHHGSITQQLNLEPYAGLAECLHGRLNPLSAIRRIEPLGWHFLPSGQRNVGSPTELLQPQELSNLFQKLSSQFDWIVVDSPPILPLSDAVALRQHIDGALLVARAGSTPAKAVNDAIALLGRKHILGLILNGVEKLNQPYSSYYQYRSGGKATAADITRKDPVR